MEGMLYERGAWEECCGCHQISVNARSLQLEYARVLHERLLVPVLLPGSENMVWKQKERSNIRTVQRDTLSSFFRYK